MTKQRFFHFIIIHLKDSQSDFYLSQLNFEMKNKAKRKKLLEEEEEEEED